MVIEPPVREVERVLAPVANVPPAPRVALMLPPMTIEVLSVRLEELVVRSLIPAGRAPLMVSAPSVEVPLFNIRL